MIARPLLALAMAAASLTLPRAAPGGPAIPRADWVVEGDQVAALLGQSAAAAGDVNGDGYPDVIVAAPNYDNQLLNGGRVWVYYGSASGLSRTPGWKAGWDQRLAQFGYSVGTAGDVNGDGYDDVIVGCPDCMHGHQPEEGSAFVFYGSASGPSSTPDWTVESNQRWALLGLTVGTAGDVNGDGYDDVIVGCPDCRDHQHLVGLAYLYEGGPLGLSQFPAWKADVGGGLMGWSVGTAGDVNRDGYSDVIVGAPVYSDDQDYAEGTAFVYQGSPSGLPTAPSWSADSDNPYSEFGAAVGTAGDVNGDGYDDVVVGAYRYYGGEINEGAAFAYEGSATGLSDQATWMVESDQANCSFGYAVGTEGDVNGDGYDEVIVGAYYFDDGQDSEGEAFAYQGSPAGLGTTPYWTGDGDQPRSWFGYAVGTAGDVNADGYADVIVTAPSFDHGQMDEGVAAVYLGPIPGRPYSRAGPPRRTPPR